MRRGGGALLAVVSLAGCGRYAEFRLPEPEGRWEEEVRVRWEAAAEPVMGRGPTGSWEGGDVLNPSVVRHEGRLWNLYSAFDGRSWHTGVAKSGDGVRWEQRRRVLSPAGAGWEGGYIAANGSALRWRGEWWYWYQAGAPPRIGVARSRDGVEWRKAGEPVLDCGPRGSWDERGVGDPYVIEAGGNLFLFYLGQDRARRQRLGVARSEDGLKWVKLRRSPILELGEAGAFDENGLGEPAVWSGLGRWWMLYTGRDRRERRRMGLAWSRDGVEWRRHQEGAVIEGSAAWMTEVVCDPAVERVSEREIRVWFGGGDVAHPAENINGQIGFGTLYLERP